MFDLASLPVALTRTPAAPPSVPRRQDDPRRRVVVPLDGSAASEAIVPIVARLTRHVRCEIVLLHAVGNFSSAQGAERALDMQANATQAAFAYLATVADRLITDGFSQIRRSIWYKEPVLAISKAATCEQVDLIAMAITGRLRLTRAGFTGVAGAVMRSTRSPFLLVRGSSHWLGTFEHVAVPLDGSSADVTVLAVVSAISEPERTRIHLVRAIDPARRLARRDAELYLAGVAARLRDQGLVADWTVILAQAPDVIAHFATRVGAELVTMATSIGAGTAFTRGVLTALNAATCPLLLLRPGLPVQPWPFSKSPLSDARAALRSVSRRHAQLQFR